MILSKMNMGNNAAALNAKRASEEAADVLQNAKRASEAKVCAGRDQTDLETYPREAESKIETAAGKKDFSRPEHNELFATVGR